MDGGGSSDRGGKDAAQIEQRNGFAKRKDDKPWSIANSVDSSSALEDLRGTRINIRGCNRGRPGCSVAALRASRKW
jgi:hypothetical protein